MKMDFHPVRKRLFSSFKVLRAWRRRQPPHYNARGSTIKQEAPPLMSDGASLGDDEGLLHLVEGDGIALYFKDGSVGDGACLRIVGVKSATLLACRADHDPIVVPPEGA